MRSLMAPIVRVARRVAALCAVVALAGCSGSTDRNSNPTVPTPTTPTLASVVVTLRQDSLVVGDTASATAAGVDSQGRPIATGSVVWSSSGPSVASVSSGGVVTALTAGRAQIIATAGGKQGQVAVSVVVPKPPPMIIAQEFHLVWRTPRYVSGQLPTGLAAFNPWHNWSDDFDIDPETLVGGTTWRRNTVSEGYPLLGPFDSRNTDVLRWQIRLAKNAGLGGVLVDLFANDAGDFDPEWVSIFAQLLDISSQEGFKIGVLDEVAFGNAATKNPTTMTKRATNFLQRFKDHPAYLSIDGEPVYQFSFYNLFLSYQDLNTLFANVEATVGPVFWIVQGNATSDLLASTRLKAIQGNILLPTEAGTVDWAHVADSSQKFVTVVQQHAKRAAINIFPGFAEAKLRRSTTRVIHRDHGNTLTRQLDLARQARADFVVISSFNDGGENSAITPGWDFEDYAGDPYQYLRIVASVLGRTFVVPPLPPIDAVDPLIAGKLYGVDRAGPATSAITITGDTAIGANISDDMSKVAAAEYFLDGNQSVRLAATDQENALRVIHNYFNGATTPTTRGGRVAQTTNGVYVAVHDLALTPGDYDAYVVLEYFDEGTDWFGIEYASTSNAFTSTSRLSKKNSGTWRTYVFHLDHATFSGEEGAGADFRIYSQSGSLTLARISVVLPGQGHALSAVDGAFDSATEGVRGSLVLPGDGDLHTLLVHGKDSAGNWGRGWASVLVR